MTISLLKLGQCHVYIQSPCFQSSQRLWSLAFLSIGWSEQKAMTLIPNPLLSPSPNPAKHLNGVSNSVGSPDLINPLRSYTELLQSGSIAALVHFLHTVSIQNTFLFVGTMHLGRIPFDFFLWQIIFRMPCLFGFLNVYWEARSFISFTRMQA